MNYLKITNKGLIEAEDLMLIGSSTKREQTNKIGMFGSGWKYALAWLLRNDCKPVIFSGDKQIDIDFNIVLHRNNPVKVITVNGKETSLTTEMGPQWTGWMAIREIVSNAIDEGEHTITSEFNPTFQSNENITSIYIPMNRELQEVMANFNSYFSFYRTPTFECSKGRIFLKSSSTPISVYRKGIRCYDTKYTSSIDVDLEDVSINESRLAEYYSIESKVSEIVKEGVPTDILLAILKDKDSYSYGLDFLPSNPSLAIIESLKEILSTGGSFTTTLIQKAGGLFVSKPDAIVIPQVWYIELQSLGLVPDLFELFNGSNETFIETNALNVKEIQYYLSNFNISVSIKSGKCSSDVFVNNNIAYVNDETRKSLQEIAGLIIQKLPVSFYVSNMS